MSAIGFLVLLVIAIVVLMLLMTKVKLNPVMSLFVVALAFGVVLGVFGTEGYTFMGTLNMITTGFGSTLGSLGMPIILGAVLAMGVQDTGAAKSIANFFIKLFKRGAHRFNLLPQFFLFILSKKLRALRFSNSFGEVFQSQLNFTLRVGKDIEFLLGTASRFTSTFSSDATNLRGSRATNPDLPRCFAYCRPNSVRLGSPPMRSSRLYSDWPWRVK